eukprot:scaffold389223_cov43-Attheya_sp.AAC.1
MNQNSSRATAAEQQQQSNYRSSSIFGARSMKVNAIELISANGAPAQMNGLEVDSQDIEILGNNPTVTSLKESLSTIIPQPNL